MALNRNIVSKYNPPYRNSSTSYNAEMLEGFPTDGIFSGRCTGIDPETGLYNFELRPDAVIRTKDDLHLPDNYLFYLGTPTSPLTGGFSLSADYKEFRLKRKRLFGRSKTIRIYSSSRFIFQYRIRARNHGKRNGPDFSKRLIHAISQC
ncbi:MAG: hypothetical protein V8R52_07245 [Coprobacter fastidiosus]